MYLGRFRHVCENGVLPAAALDWQVSGRQGSAVEALDLRAIRQTNTRVESPFQRELDQAFRSISLFFLFFFPYAFPIVPSLHAEDYLFFFFQFSYCLHAPLIYRYFPGESDCISALCLLLYFYFFF